MTEIKETQLVNVLDEDGTILTLYIYTESLANGRVSQVAYTPDGLICGRVDESTFEILGTDRKLRVA